MSNQNDMFRELQGLKQNRKVVVATYTAKVGRASDGFIIDNPIISIDPTSSFSITIPDGYVEGQRLLVSFSSESDDVTVTVDTGKTDYALSQEGDYCCLEWVNSTVGWIALSELTT